MNYGKRCVATTRVLIHICVYGNYYFLGRSTKLNEG